MKYYYSLLLLLSFNFSTHAQNLAWAKQFIGAAQGLSVVADDSGYTYTTGVFNGTVDFDPGVGVHNMQASYGPFILKLDPAGNFVWSKRLFSGEGWSIALDRSGNVIVAGVFSFSQDFDEDGNSYYLPTIGYRDAFIWKMDKYGHFLWAKQIGGSDTTQCNAMRLDAQGNIYLAGRFYGTTDFDPGTGSFDLTSAAPHDAFITKLDSNGSFIWAKQIESNGRSDAYGINVDSAGNVYTTGYFTGTADFDPDTSTFNLTGLRSAFITRLDSAGHFKWARSVDPDTTAWGYDVATDRYGGVYCTGYFEHNANFDPGGSNATLTALGESDAFLVKYDTAGNFNWAKQFGSTTPDFGWSLTIDDSSKMYMSTSGQAIGGFLHRLDTAGVVNWSIRNASGYALTPDFCLRRNGDMYLTGTFRGTSDFDPGTGTLNYTTGFDPNFYVQKLVPYLTSVDDADAVQVLALSPNPVQSVLQIASQNNSIGRVNIYDLTGKLIVSKQLNVRRGTIDMSSLAPGMYLAEISGRSYKVVKE